MKDSLRFVLVGHVDHGKSTLIGRLLADTDSLQEGVIQKVKGICQQRGKEFEYAYLLDALQEEQEQGITIDITKIEFSTPKRHYTIIDAPGHIEFLRNMVSGASNAEAAVLIVDAKEGVQEQTRRHALLLSLLGIEQLYVVINKMDLVGYSEERFNEIKQILAEYLGQLDLRPILYIPVSAKLGDNMTGDSSNMGWYEGPNFFGALEKFKVSSMLEEKPLRIPVQDVFKFSEEQRLVVGKVESGKVTEGDEVTFLPSGKRSRIISLESWLEKDKKFSATVGMNVSLRIADELFLPRGEVIIHQKNKPEVSNMFKTNLFWLGEKNVEEGNKYKLKLGTQEVNCEIRTIEKTIDAQTLEALSTTHITRNGVGIAMIKTEKPIVFDSFKDVAPMGRFVLVENGIVAGGGIIIRPVVAGRVDVETKVKHISPKFSLIETEEREARHGHKGFVLWLTGLPGSRKEIIARELERNLFDKGREVYYLDAANVRYTLSSDLDFSEEGRHEQSRRVAEVAHILQQTGMIVIVSIVSPYKNDRKKARDIIGEDNFLEVFVDVPVEVCKLEDPHGIYSRAERGEIKGIPGIDTEYEHSDYLNLILPVRERDFKIEEKIKQIIKFLENKTLGNRK